MNAFLRSSCVSARVRAVLLLMILLLPAASARAQSRGQTVRGTVVDADLQTPLPGANVVVAGVEPLLGTMTDADGRFVLEHVPLGRQTILVSFIGYEPATLSNVVVGSGHEVVLTIALRERVVQGEEVVVTAGRDREQPVNDMAYVSARSFTVEETRRYGGGLDDPARMASVFAGVAATGGIQQNALVIRGNAPRGVLWRLEGVEIPNPNHFAELSVSGGGGLTLFSAQLLADSDFFTGAFPAEYGNALSGVFDMRFRTGNPAQRQHTVQVGINGVEAASEGPFVRGKEATYLFNYRYSTLALLMPLLPTDAPVTYQDLSFKLSFPTRKAGRFEVWGIGGLDGQRLEENRDSTEWESEFWDRTRFDMDLAVGAAGLSHRLVLGSRSYLRTVAAATVNRTRWDQHRLADDLTLQPNLFIDNTDGRLILGSTLHTKLGSRHVNRTGATVQQLFYDLHVTAAPGDVPPVVPVAGGEGASTLLQVFTQSRLNPTAALTLNAGLHAQYFALTQRYTVEPRAGLTWQFTPEQSVSLGYGLHSRIEDLRIYLAQVPRAGGFVAPNRDLDFTKAHHGVLGYSRSLGPSARLKLEAYYQHLYDVPVVADSSYALLNFEQDWTFAETLVNAGAGRNAGLDLTVERFLQDGWYALVTGSVFRSRYRGGDGTWRSTRFDQRYVANALFGKEFAVGARRNLLGLNARVLVVGGKMRSPVDQAASRLREEVVYDEARAFTVREPGLYLLDVTITYRLNRRRRSEVWALQLKNALAAKDTYLDYNFASQRVETVEEGFPLPVLSYKVEF